MSNSEPIPKIEKYENIEVLVPSLDLMAGKILYEYLFESKGVVQIEIELLGDQYFRGFLPKCILNYYGVNTDPSCGNRGLYKYYSYQDVMEHLLFSLDPKTRQIGERIFAYRNPYETLA